MTKRKRREDAMKNVHHKLGSYVGGNIWYLRNSSGTFIQCMAEVQRSGWDTVSSE
jgi:hypothetical protein